MAPAPVESVAPRERGRARLNKTVGGDARPETFPSGGGVGRVLQSGRGSGAAPPWACGSGASDRVEQVVESDRLSFASRVQEGDRTNSRRPINFNVLQKCCSYGESFDESVAFLLRSHGFADGVLSLGFS